MKKYLKVVLLALSVFLLSACGSNGNNIISSIGSNNGSSNIGGSGNNSNSDNSNSNVEEVVKSVSISFVKGENGTYSFKPEFHNIESNEIKYTWSFGGRIYEPAQKSVSNPVVTYVDDGEYVVKLTAEVDGEVLESNTITLSYTLPVKVTSNYGYMSIGSGSFNYSASAIKDKKLYAWGHELASMNATYYNLDDELIKDVVYTAGAHIVLTESGKVYTAGGNTNGVLGDGTTTSREEFKVVEALKDLVIKKIYAGAHSVYAIDSEGKVWSWGNNLYGQLGIGTQEDSYLPVQIVGLEARNIIKIAVGENSVYAIDEYGQVYSWGNNKYGQLGIGNLSNKTVPYKVHGLENKVITDVFVDGKTYSRVYAIDTDGKLYGWGYNIYGDLGSTVNTENNTAANIIENLKDKAIVSFAMNSVLSMYAVDVDGNIYSWGSGGTLGHSDTYAYDSNNPTLIEYFRSNNIKVKKVIAGKGTDTIFVIDAEGNVYGWGDNWAGQLGINGENSEYYTPYPVESLKGNKIIYMPSGTDITPFAISDNGKIFAAGSNYNSGEFGLKGLKQDKYYEFIDISNLLDANE